MNRGMNEKDTKKQIVEELKVEAGIQNNCVFVEEFLFTDDNGNEKVSIDKVADYLLNKFSFKTIFGIKSDIIYLYNNGIWIKDGRGKIKTETERLLKSWCKNNLVNEILEKIKRKTEIKSDDFNKIPEGLVCLENGVLNLKEKKFLEHSPEYYFKTKLPLFYDTEVDCPSIKKFLLEVLYAEDVDLIQEWLGYNLYNVYFEKKAMILFGDPDTGKTLFLNVLNKFVGEKNKVGLGLQKISIGKSFDLLNLKDKYANIYDDLSEKDLSDGGGFKIATGGGFISGEVKFGDRIDFKTFAKLTFACNKIPPIKKVDDEAYWKRWLPVPFDNIFAEKDQDKFLLKKLTTQKEMSGLLNWAIEGLNRLLKNNRFSFNKSLEEVKQMMQRSSHPLSAFSQDCLIQNNGIKISKKEMFAVYSDWCEKKPVARMTIEQLGRQLIKFVPYILAGRAGKERYWLNVSFENSVIIPRVNDTSDTNIKTIRDYYKEENSGSSNISLINPKKASQESQDIKNTTNNSKEKDVVNKLYNWSDEDKKRLALANSIENKSQEENNEI